jgi:hypothetical protein
MEPQWKQFDNCEIYQYYIHDGLCADRKCACFLSPDRTFNESADVYTAHIVASQGHIEASHDATSTELGDVVSPRDGSSDIGAEGMQQNVRYQTLYIILMNQPVAVIPALIYACCHVNFDGQYACNHVKRLMEHEYVMTLVNVIMGKILFLYSTVTDRRIHSFNHDRACGLMIPEVPATVPRASC